MQEFVVEVLLDRESTSKITLILKLSRYLKRLSEIVPLHLTYSKVTTFRTEN